MAASACVVVGYPVEYSRGMQIKISDMGVTCPSHQLGDIVVKGCSLGNGGVWLSVAAELVAFWLEIHVPMRECKERW